jgi:type I restriction enzyme S subunit
MPERPLFVARFKDMERWSHESILRSSISGPNPCPTRPLSRLGDLISDLENGWSPKCHDHPASVGHWGVLKLGAVSFGIYDEDENKQLPTTLRPRPEYEVHPGDVLISRANVVRYVGACAYVESTRDKLMLCDKIFRVRFRPDGKLAPQFLAAVMKLRFVRDQIESRLTGTSPTMKNISKPALLGLFLPVPDDMAIQESLVDLLAKSHQEAALKRAKATALRQSAWSAFEAALFTPAEATP